MTRLTKIRNSTGALLPALTKLRTNFKKRDSVWQQPPLLTSLQQERTERPISESSPGQYNEVIETPTIEHTNNGISNILNLPFTISVDLEKNDTQTTGLINLQRPLIYF